MWVRVNKAGDVWQHARRMVSVSVGEKSVKRELGDAIIKAGLGEEIEAPARTEGDDTGADATATPVAGKAKK